MTHTSTEQPEALRMADLLEKEYGSELLDDAANELRTQHARIEELEDVADMAIKRIAEMEAQLAAIGAGGVEPLRKQAVPAAVAEQEENQGQYLFDVVLNCPHSITHDAITLHFYPKQKEGHNAPAQLRHRLAAADAADKAREMELLAVIEDLERLIPLINQGEIKA